MDGDAACSTFEGMSDEEQENVARSIRSRRMAPPAQARYMADGEIRALDELLQDFLPGGPHYRRG